MSVSIPQSFNDIPTAGFRKRKRNNSSISLPDGLIPPLSTPNASPEKSITHQQHRPSTPPPYVQRRSTASPSCNELQSDAPASPIVVRSIGSDLSLSGSQSPRSSVAKRLSTLNLSKADDQQDTENIPSEHSDPQYKAETDNSHGELTSTVQGSPILSQPERPYLKHASSSNQRPKKRLPPPRGIKSPPPKSSRPPPDIAPPSTTTNTQSTSSATTQTISTQPPEPNTTTTTTTPTPENWLDLSTLTWQDSEITGHLMLDPDDDGYGINGIGFRPTPAMASVRSQRRKQQLTAWRTREEREERERRAEKRRLGRLSGLYTESSTSGHGHVPSLNLAGMGESMDKKMVRFAV